MIPERRSNVRARFCVFVGLLAFLVAGAPAAASKKKVKDAEVKRYATYARVLSSYVDDKGMVQYKALKAGRADLDQFAGWMGSLKAEEFAGWSRGEKVAFWINAYNALTLKLIIDHYPIKADYFKSFTYPKNSIRQISGAWTGKTFPVMGKKLTLDHIEHKILRAEFKEPRIHMALVCAAMSCPRLYNEPFLGSMLDSQFIIQLKDFLGHSGKFRIDRTKREVHLSKIFKWFSEDFVGVYGVGESRLPGKDKEERAVINYIMSHVSDADRAFLAKSKEYDIEYLKYDWSLNEKK
jgi:hypothetical protein